MQEPQEPLKKSSNQNILMQNFDDYQVLQSGCKLITSQIFGITTTPWRIYGIFWWKIFFMH
jgi:hypothetical protein